MADTSAAEAALKAKLSRKRTKTGCLTCRKRRIKCDEGRPVCKNCVKSKRHCEGYSQRVVFKQPTFDYQPGANGSAHITFQAGPDPGALGHSHSGQALLNQAYYTHLRPRPSQDQFITIWDQRTQQYVHIPAPAPEQVQQSPTEAGHSQLADGLGPINQDGTRQSAHANHFYAPPPPIEHARSMQTNGNHALKQESPQSAAALQAGGPSTPELYEHEFHAPPTMTPTYVLSAAAVEKQDDEYYDVDDDDLDQEQDVDTSLSQLQSHKRQRMLGRVLEGNQISIRGLQMRRYDTFIYDGILDTYRVEYVASPLKNPATARVFAHFISATGPSLSVFERTPNTSSVLFNGGTVPIAQQGLWTYTLPMAALHHQGLLHAMLALASLHIARLQGASTTPSMQHYAWALRRIHAAVSNPKSRLKATTIAASMLLGFYEVMTADHMKWNMHLMGAKQLFVETDFVQMTAAFKRMKMERAMHLSSEQDRKRRYSTEQPFSQGDLLDQMHDIDERVVSRIVGKEVKYDIVGHVEPSTIKLPPALDLCKFDILRDLYWWYCKQDVIQSIVSGNKLLMDFNRWPNCPPRSPLGRGDAVCGSSDHLILLLGRIADFSSRDRKRKLKQMEANGGHWRPAPGMNIPRPPPTPQQAAPSPASAHLGMPMPGAVGGPPMTSPPMPDFYGMAPPPRANVHMPSSYTSSNPHTTPTPAGAYPPGAFENDLPQATQEALDEYTHIQQALDLFEQSLSRSPAFQPLESGSYHSAETAFGPAYFFRTYDIGCLWAFYHMAMIIAIRAHPHMPPAAHMAAGVAAQETRHHAMEIGRIVAGIVPGPDDQPLNPSLGAALCDSCMPSFFAAVQYQDARQRYETVTRIFSIARRTGWGSAELIANGCETAWVKAAAVGRGPPYTRIVRAHHTNSEDPRLTGSWERLDPRSAPVDGDDADRRLVKTKKEARLNWAIGVMGVEEDVEKIKLVD
ncbi:hypothetical protein CERZMDRAFT_63943 [Cercospora zeae-maydis SCOH1-5]|uniref:Zn(2)-C6 fungal-type domain-containing protein n=1 Tax=Cercospora zeae-maydis SCOH1-5 TaxID=717836 RepID=A0A6A6FWF9_9PEZI|nr:hypothetical protein CERZMDRAFT_63943 [Cercospora zeae-maydis SCOH1-5]